MIQNYLALILLVILAQHGYGLLKSCLGLDFVAIMPEYRMFWRLLSLIPRLIFDISFQSSVTPFHIPHEVYPVPIYSTLSQPYELQS